MSKKDKITVNGQKKSGDMAVPFPAAFSKYNLDTLEEQMYLLAFMLITTGHTELVDIGWGLPWFTGKELNELQRRKAIADALLRLKSKKLVELYDDKAYTVVPPPLATQRELFELPLAELLIGRIKKFHAKQALKYTFNYGYYYAKILTCDNDDRIMQISEVHRDVLHNIDGIMMQFWTMDSEEKDYRALMVYADWLAPALIKEPDFLSPTTLVANLLATIKKKQEVRAAIFISCCVEAAKAALRVVVNSLPFKTCFPNA